jgi:hypothetical protein
MGGICLIAPRKRCSTSSSSTRPNRGDRRIHTSPRHRRYRGDAEKNIGFVGLVGVEQIGRKLGCFAKHNGSSPVAIGSSVPVCPCLGCRKQPRRLQGRIGRQPRNSCRAAGRRQRVATCAWGGFVAKSVFESWNRKDSEASEIDTASWINFDRSAPAFERFVENESASCGVEWMVMRLPNSRRRKPEAFLQAGQHANPDARAGHMLLK